MEKNHPDIQITPTDGTPGYGGRMFAKLSYKANARIPGGPWSTAGVLGKNGDAGGLWGYSWPFLDVFMLIEKDGKVIRKSVGVKEWCDGRSLFFVVVLHERDTSCASVSVFFSMRGDRRRLLLTTRMLLPHLASTPFTCPPRSPSSLAPPLPSTENHNSETYPKAEIFPSVACKFENVSFQCPPAGKAILDRDYKGWATDCDSGNHNHRTEAPRTGQEKVVCKGLDPAIAKLLTKPA